MGGYFRTNATVTKGTLEHRKTSRTNILVWCASVPRSPCKTGSCDEERPARRAAKVDKGAPTLLSAPACGRTEAKQIIFLTVIRRTSAICHRIMGFLRCSSSNMMQKLPGACGTNNPGKMKWWSSLEHKVTPTCQSAGKISVKLHRLICYL